MIKLQLHVKPSMSVSWFWSDIAKSLYFGRLEAEDKFDNAIYLDGGICSYLTRSK